MKDKCCLPQTHKDFKNKNLAVSPYFRHVFEAFFLVIIDNWNSSGSFIDGFIDLANAFAVAAHPRVLRCHIFAATMRLLLDNL